MSKNEKKEKLLQLITNIEDESIINTLLGILDQDMQSSEIFQLSENQAKMIREAQHEYAKCSIVSNEKINKIVGDWLECGASAKSELFGVKFKRDSGLI